VAAVSDCLGKNKWDINLTKQKHFGKKLKTFMQ
jgi:hypothetical protein